MLLEVLAALVILPLSAAFAGRRPPGMRRVRRWLRAICRHRWAPPVAVATGTLLLLLALGLVAGWPVPACHDEFAYLLGADTFAHGRLANSTHPLWRHFESFHIIHQPTYQMKYPPAQAVALACGQTLGHPALGVWLTLALATGAVTWMLQGWVPARWALLGGALTAMNAGLLLHWGFSYWGGAMAMLGGALVFGAFARIRREPRLRDSMLLALGLGILANSRPYEGLLASLPVAFALAWHLITSGRISLRLGGTRILAPFLVASLPIWAWMGYYNFRVTGDPFRMPYSVWHDTYVSGGWSGSLLASASDSDYNNPWRRIRLPAALEARRDSLALPQIRPTAGAKLLSQWVFYIRPLLTIPLVAALLSFRLPRLWLPIVGSMLVVTAVIAGNSGGYAHYTAPVAGLFTLLIVEGLRQLRLFRIRSKRMGNLVVYLLVGLVVLSNFGRLAEFTGDPERHFAPMGLARQRIQRQLEKNGQRHLVLVQYRANHHISNEWVYNRADIDAAPVIWAHTLTPQENQVLLDYYKDRTVWLLDADASPPRLIPQPASSNSRE